MSKGKTVSVRINAADVERLARVVLVTGRLQSVVLSDLLSMGLGMAERRLQRQASKVTE